MKKLVLLMVIVMAAVPPCAHSQPFSTAPQDDLVLRPQGDVVIRFAPESKELFRMSPGACLRGPLYFKDSRNNRVIFQLDAGVDYPTGCSKE